MSTSNPQPLVYDDYCLATKWNDGDARDPWVVGFYREKASRHPPEFSVVADNSVSTKTGFRRCQKITREQGNYLLANAKELEEAGVKLWELLSTLNPSQSSEARLTADDIQPGPYSEDHLRQSWNNQADEYNQWDSLGLSEQLAWAQAQVIAHGGFEHQRQDFQLQPPADGEVANAAAKADAVEAARAAVSVALAMAEDAKAVAAALAAALEEAKMFEAAAWARAAEAAAAAKAMADAMAAPKTEAAELEPQPQPSEVAELMDELTWLAGQLVDIGWSDHSGIVTRAAELLQHQAAPQPQPKPQPIPVGERPWTRDGWCDEKGECWMGLHRGVGFIPSWRKCRPEDALSMGVSLPVDALPLPIEEVEQ